MDLPRLKMNHSAICTLKALVHNPANEGLL
jgi:hypothetical protein